MWPQHMQTKNFSHSHDTRCKEPYRTLSREVHKTKLYESEEDKRAVNKLQIGTIWINTSKHTWNKRSKNFPTRTTRFKQVNGTNDKCSVNRHLYSATLCKLPNSNAECQSIGRWLGREDFQIKRSSGHTENISWQCRTKISRLQIGYKLRTPQIC